jgi:hypothetical protein
MQPLRALAAVSGEAGPGPDGGGGESPGLHGTKWRKVGDTPPAALAPGPGPGGASSPCLLCVRDRHRTAATIFGAGLKA